MEAIDEAISGLLSHQVVLSLYANLDSKFSVSREEIPYRLDTFFEALEKVFGAGAKTLGRTIARKFYLKLGLEFQVIEGATLLEYVENAKRTLTKSTNETNGTKG